MARTRHVYPTEEIAHLWAHEQYDEACNPGSNFFFNGPTIYSYGTHFPIATHVKHGKKKAIVFTTRRYSITTSRHINRVQMAIPHGATVFHVQHPLGRPQEGFADYQSQINATLEAASKARVAGRRPELIDDVIRLAAEGNAFAKFFGIRRKIKVPKFDETQLAADRKTALKAEAKRLAAQKVRNDARNALWEAARKEREAVARQCALENAEDWRAGKATGVYSMAFQHIPTMLRVSEDKLRVETSMGAHVPVSHAKRLLTLVRAVVERGCEEWVANGHSFHIGHYTVDRIETNGTLRAGCHVIQYEEIERCAKLLEEIPLTTETV